MHFHLFVSPRLFSFIYIQYTPDNSNLQGTDENGSSYREFELSGLYCVYIYIYAIVFKTSSGIFSNAD